MMLLNSDFFHVSRHKKTVFHSLFILFLIFSLPANQFGSLIISDYPDALAQTPQPELYRGDSYSDIDYNNGTHKWTGGLPQYVETGQFNADGKKIYTHYIVDDQPTYVKVTNGEASFVFDKTTCSAKIYDGGLITDSNNSIIGSDSFVPLQSVDGSGIWNVVTSVRDATCVTSIVETPTSISVSGTRISSAGIFKITYVKEDGKPLESFLEPTNLTSFTNRRFGVVQTQQIPQIITWANQQRDLANFVGQTFNRQWLENNQQNLSNLFEYGNLQFNVLGAWNYLDSVKINSVNNGLASVSFNYIRNTPILLPNETLLIDPTYSSNNPTQDGDVTSTTSTGTLCSTTGSTKNTATDYVRSSISDSDLNSDCVRGYVEWDITSITDGYTITDSVMKFHQLVSSSKNCDYNEMNTQPSTGTADQVYDDIADGTTFVDNSAVCTTTGANKSIDLGASGDADVTSQMVSANWFAVGIKFDNETRDSTSGHTQGFGSEENTGDAPNPKPTLEVTYVAPTCTPNAPTLPSAESSSTSQIDISWTAPTNCTMTTTEVQQSATGAFAGEQTTIYSSTPKTSHSDTILSGNEDYFYRIRYMSDTSTWGSYSSTVSDLTTPTAPTSPTVTSTTSTTMGLSWTAPTGSGTLTYKIEEKIGVGAFTTREASYAGTTYSATSLSGGTLYTYRISAINSDSTGTTSTEFGDTTYPGTPTSLTATATSGTNINLSWSAPSGAVDGYKIERKIGAGAYSTLVADTGTTATTYSDSGLTSSTLYTYRVTALNGVDVGSSTSNEAFDTTDAVPSAPLSPSVRTDTTHAVTARWTVPTDCVGCTGYKIWNATSGGVIVNDTGSTSTSRQLTGLTSGKLQQIKVSAWNATGIGANSTTASNYTINTAPVLDDVKAYNSTAFNLFYTINGTFNGIKVETDELPYASFSTLIANSTSSAITLIVNGITPMIDTAVKIYAHNLGGTSIASNQIINATNATSAPVLVSVSQTSLVSTLNLVFTAPVNGTATSYDVYRSPSGCGTLVFVANTSTLTYTSSGLVASTQYCFRIFGVNGYGLSTGSNLVNQTTISSANPGGGSGGSGGSTPVKPSVGGALLLNINSKTFSHALGEKRTYSLDIVWEKTKEYSLTINSIKIGQGQFDSLSVIPEVIPPAGKKIIEGKGEIFFTVDAPSSKCEQIQSTARCVYTKTYVIPITVTVSDVLGTIYPDIPAVLTVIITEKFPIGLVIIIVLLLASIYPIAKIISMNSGKKSRKPKDIKNNHKKTLSDSRKNDSNGEKHKKILKDSRKVDHKKVKHNLNIFKKIKKEF